MPRPAPQARLVRRCSGTLQGFVSGEAYILGEKPEDSTVLDEGIRGNAKSTGDERLTTLTPALRAARPDLFDADSENPIWCDTWGLPRREDQPTGSEGMQALQGPDPFGLLAGCRTGSLDRPFRVLGPLRQRGRGRAVGSIRQWDRASGDGAASRFSSAIRSPPPGGRS